MGDKQARSARSSSPAALLASAALLIALLTPSAAALADHSSPGRHRTITADVKQYLWWLTEWETNDAVCEVVVDHDGQPTRREVLEDCGHESFAAWLATPACQQDDPADCSGLYLHFVGSEVRQQNFVVDLPEPSVELDVAGCELSPPLNRCSSLPDLLLQGIEPLPNHTITAIRGTIDGVPFHCADSACEVPFTPSPDRGKRLDFWAVSSYGDTSQRYSGRIRAVPAPDDGWYIDVLSSQFRAAPPASCAQTWQALPSAGRLPHWLDTPETAQELASSELYAQLAHQLVERGVVDTADCPNLGYLEDGALNACGLEAARPLVSSWQNRFDQRILDVARDRNVPAQLLKNLFAQESQLWPGLYRQAEDEFGFGQLTDHGADATLLWNAEFFGEFCPLILSEGACSQGYSGLQPGERALLRGALLRQADASCADCDAGIDLSRADASVSVFAEALLANCEQVGRMIRNTAGVAPGEVASYQTLWEMTIANYHGGAGCVGAAIEASWDERGVLRWPEVAQNMTQACEGLPGYVERVTAP